MKNFFKKIPKFLSDIIIILCLSFFTGLICYQFSDNFTFKESESHQNNLSQYSYISIEEAITAFEDNQALFVDARHNDEYIISHIENAENFPADNLDSAAMDFLTKYPDKEINIIVYCDGKDCDLSSITYDFLQELGYENINILNNGFTLWKESHMPITTNN